MDDKTRIYLTAVEYSFQKLGQGSLGYWERIRDLVERGCSLDEITFVIDNVWVRPARPVSAETFKVGAKWGDSVLLEHVSGNQWRARCRCKKKFVLSTAEGQPRQCPACVLRESIERDTEEYVAQVRARAALLSTWHDGCEDSEGPHDKKHDGHDGYSKMVKACVVRRLNLNAVGYDKPLVAELVARCWEKIAERMDEYDPHKTKVSTFIWMLCDGLVRDFLKQSWNRQRLVPTCELDAMPEIEERIPHPDGIQPPAKPVRPAGKAHDNEDTTVSPYDAKIGGLWAS